MLNLRTLTLILFSCCLLACNNSSGPGHDISVPQSVDENSLKAREALEFAFEVETQGKYRITTDILYYQGNVYTEDPKETRIETLPIYFQIDKVAGGEERELLTQKEFSIPLKDELGWRGKLSDNNHDRLLTETAFSEYTLAKGQHVFKMFANSPGEHNISGILEVTVHLDKRK